MKVRSMAVYCGTFFLIMGNLGAPSHVLAGESFNIDTGHSSILFKVKHLSIAESYGRFNDFSGTLALNADEPARSKVEVTVNANSIDTANEKRDKHLRSPDFFNVKQFAEISFASTNIERKQDRWYIRGNLTFMGKTKPITITLKKTGEGNDPWGNYRQGWHGTTTLRRSEFGMNYGVAKDILGDEVELIFSLEGVRG